MLPRLLAALGLAAAVSAVSAVSARADASPAPIGHVWVLVLENEDYAKTYGPNSPAPFLARQLTRQGALAPNYYAIGHLSLDNYIAMISGQGPNPVTQADCPFYADVFPGSFGPDGQALGAGCVYPGSVQTLADQLSVRGLSWRGYMEDVGNAAGQPSSCRHPALNSPDSTQKARVGDQYAARHNPFVYFHSVIDAPACAANIVGLEGLARDLYSVATTPTFSFITPNLCHDGHDEPCVDGEPGGLVSADRFLQTWVPVITGSAAFKADGLLAIVFDEAGASDASACCSEQAISTPNAGGTTVGPGGGKTGAVLLSPYIAGGTITQQAYNHYSLLRSIEDIFGLGHLGYAGASGLRPFGGDVFTGSGPAVSVPVAGCVTTRVRGRGRQMRGTLIGDATAVGRSGGGSRLAVVAGHGARMNVAVRTGGRWRTVVGGRRVRACQRYVFALPSRHGQARVLARVGDAREARALRY